MVFELCIFFTLYMDFACGVCVCLVYSVLVINDHVNT